MKIILLILISIFFFSGCSTTIYMKSPEKSPKDYSLINSLGERNSSHIILTDQKEIWRDYIHVENDSLFYGLNESELNSIPLKRINKVFIKDKLSSFNGAVLSGLGTGLLTGFVIYLTSRKKGHPETNYVLLGAIVAPFGFVFGYLTSGHVEFVFNEINN